MHLPGGLWHNGRRYRGFGFRPLTGAIELAVSEASQQAATLPEAITNVLLAALGHIGDLEPDVALVDALSVGDRQFLTTRLAGRLGGDEAWFTANCRACGERFDFALRFSELPVKPAGPSYPFCETVLGVGKFKWRVPNGGDQKALALQPPDEDAVRVLLQRCLVHEATGAGGATPAKVIADLTDSEIAQVEAALETLSPEMADRVQAACAGCSQVNEIVIDPLSYMSGPSRGVSVDIHRIASVYHWSEAEILSLPRQRRRRYLDLIDRARGMSV
ncbi:MAG: hypothetical protein PVG19_10935 [Desulfobacterales bacterium]|jgi:hypothetical protein